MVQYLSPKEDNVPQYSLLELEDTALRTVSVDEREPVLVRGALESPLEHGGQHTVAGVRDGFPRGQEPLPAV